MRFSKLFFKTQREIPAEADTISHQLLLRAGMVHQLAAGVYTYMPLALRTIRKIEDIIRDEMDKAGGQEISMPVLQPVELWEKTGRIKGFGQTLFKLTDRKERTLVLGPTHEEAVTDLASKFVQSYRDLPLLPYQLQTKFRDEPRPRAGLIRVREFIMKDLYSFDADEAGLDISYNKMREAYKNIYARCGLPAMMIEADSGAIGGKDSNEFMLVAESGEDEIIYCKNCGYAANLEKASFNKGAADCGEPKEIEEVATLGKKTIEEVAEFLGVKPVNTLKSVFYMADGEFVFVVIRGDLDVNEIKLNNQLKCADLRPATDDEVRNAGIIAGSASAVGIKGFKVIADDSVKMGTNFVSGANKEGYHIKNVNYPRDFEACVIADIASASEGKGCPNCDGALFTTRGIEVGHIFKLGTFLSEKLGAYYTDVEGNSKPIVMGCYGIGVGRLLAAAIEQNHDDNGIIWPMAIAPYQICITALYSADGSVKEEAEKLYNELTEEGFEVLLDDRDESPGVKFNDADLLGIPIRVTVSKRSLKNGGTEIKLRKEKEAQIVPLNETICKIRELAC